MKIQKKEISSAKSKPKKDKGNMTAYAGIIAYIITLALRIPLCRVIGEEGVGVLAPAFEIFTLSAFLFSYGISRTMTGMIRYRVKREQYKNARKVFNVAFKLSLLAGVLLAIILTLLSGFISDTLILEPMSKKAVFAIAPALVLLAFVNVFRGYFNGNGFGVLVVHSQYIEKIVMLVSASVGGKLMYDYGLKVSALLKNDMAAYAYAAQGVMAGIMIAELLTLIYLLIIFALYSGTWKKQLAKDSARRIESSAEISAMLFGNGFPMAVIVIICNAFMLIDQRFFNYCMNCMGLEGKRASLWGVYYGKFAVVSGIGTALVCLALCGYVGKIANAYEREEYGIMYDRIGSAVKTLCVWAMPIAVFMTVMSDVFINALYKGENDLAANIMRQGSVVVFFYALIYLFGQLMLKMHMAKEFLISLAVSLMLHLAALFLLVRVKLMGAYGVLYSLIIFMGVLALLCFVFMARKLKYRQDWLHSVLFPLLSSCAAGLLTMLLKKLLLPVLGNLPSLIISALIAAVLYIMLLIVTRVLNEAELSKLPFGSLWLAFGRMLGIG